jgi:hypothetical protein
MKPLRALHRFLVPALLAIAVAGFACRSASAQNEPKKNIKFPQTVLIIRHGEKTGDNEDVHLDKQGQERAEGLYQLFEISRNRPSPLPKPDFIFAAGPHKDSVRPLETITPLAKKLKLPINNMFDSKLPPPDADKKNAKPNMFGLRDEIFGDSKYFGKTILVAWRHSTIPELAKTLKASKVPEKWDDSVFDRVWQITYYDQGNATFADLPQRLLKGDSEK